MEEQSEIFDNSKLQFDEDQNDIDSKIDMFFLYHSDTAIDILYNLKETFKLSPSFLDYLESAHLMDIFILLIFENTYNTINIKNNDLLERFINEYYNEIQSSLRIINCFLKNYNTSIPINIWIEICFAYSDLNDL